MPNRADIYLICGATGAGKSTHAEALAERVQKRNTKRAETFHFEVTREMLKFIEGL